MKIRKDSHGFAVVEILLILVIIGAIGAVGWYIKSKQTQTSTVEEATVSSTPELNISPSIYTDWKTYNGASTIKASFKYPADWTYSTEDEAINGISLYSPNFKSEQGFKLISSGSSLSVSIQDNITDFNGHTQTLDEAALGQEPLTEVNHIMVNGVDVAQLENNGMENQSKTHVAIFIKESKVYVIKQSYPLNTDNPYPNLVEGILATFTFK